MAVRARDEVTLASVTAVSYLRRYYLLQSSTLTPPAAPTVVPPPAPWVTTEPGYEEGSTDTLYTVDVTVFMDGTYDYSLVSKSSSFEAAKAAYNKAVTAGGAANLAMAAAQGLIKASLTNPGHAVGRIWLELNTDGNVINIKISDGTAWFPYSLMAAQILVPGSIGAVTIADGAVTAPKITASQELTAKVAEFLVVNADQLTAGSATFNAAFADKLWAEIIKTRKITADMALIGAGRNLVPDASLNNAAAWVTPSHVVTSGGKYGGGSIVIPASTSEIISWMGLQPEYLIPVRPGQTYRVEALLTSAISIAAINRVGLSVRFRNSAGSLINTSVVVNNTATAAANAEVALTGTITVPANAAHMAIGLAKRSGHNGIVRFIDLDVYDMADASLIVDGNIVARHINITELFASTGFINALNSTIITGATYQTTAAVNRGIKLDANGLRGYASNGRQTITLDPLTGQLLLTNPADTQRVSLRDNGFGLYDAASAPSGSEVAGAWAFMRGRYLGGIYGTSVLDLHSKMDIGDIPGGLSPVGFPLAANIKGALAVDDVLFVGGQRLLMPQDKVIQALKTANQGGISSETLISGLSITCPRDGRIRVSVSCTSFSSSTQDLIGYQIKRNGSNVKGGSQQANSSTSVVGTGHLMEMTSPFLNVVAGDVITVSAVRALGNGSITIAGSSSDPSILWVEYF